MVALNFALLLGAAVWPAVRLGFIAPRPRHVGRRGFADVVPELRLVLCYNRAGGGRGEVDEGGMR